MANDASSRKSVDGEPLEEAPRTKKAKAAKGPLKTFLVLLGPGLITGAADDDPSGIATYANVGARFGYGPLWLSLLTFPLMTCVQYICSKIGLVTGRSLAGVLNEHYPKHLLWASIIILSIANIANAGANIGAIASAVNLLVPQVQIIWMIVPVTLLLVTLIVVGGYKFVAQTFKWLSISLFAYLAAAFFCHPNLAEVARGTFVPQLNLSKDYIAAVVAILGTTISPYLFFWQASSEVDEQRDDGLDQVEQREGASKDDLKYASWDVAAGMFCSNLVMYFIILTTAATIHNGHGNHDIATASQAAAALEPVAGPYAKLLFALGLIGTGFLSTPILIATSAYAISEAMGWRHGLSEKWHEAKEFYVCMFVSCLLAMTVNFFKVSPMTILYWVAILNGVLAPPILVLVMLISSNKKIMGERTNSRPLAVIGWLTTAIMTAAVVGLILTG